MRPSLFMSPTTAAPLAPSSSANVVVGHVRATPPGHMLGGGRVVSDAANDGNVTTQQQQQQHIIETWHSVRSAPNKHIDFVKEGFDHVLGKDDVRIVDGTPVGGRIVELDDDTPHRDYSYRHRQSSRLQQKIQDAGGMKSGTWSSIAKGGVSQGILQQQQHQRRATFGAGGRGCITCRIGIPTNCIIEDGGNGAGR